MACQIVNLIGIKTDSAGVGKKVVLEDGAY
jgi:hypothetical protein